MLKYIFTLLVVISTSWAGENSTPLTVEFEHFSNQPNLNQLYENVRILIQDQGVSPEKIAVILDVNKTLSRKGKQIPESIERIKDLSKLGVLLVISSASVNFSRTLKKLNNWGLGQDLGIENMAAIVPMETLSFNEHLKLNVYRYGNIASVKKLSLATKKFVNKAFSAYTIYGDKGLHVNYAFFADDLPKNWEFFKKDIVEDQALGCEIKKVWIYEMKVKSS
jgi:hypothetical protein